jgi:sugar/nucleoside kinase (ribokinase family)
MSRILVCGDRNWVHGDCRGADRMAASAASAAGLAVETHPAKWEVHGDRAGPMRNEEMMASGVDLVVAFHDHLDRSRGTRDTLRRAAEHGIGVLIVGHGREQSLISVRDLLTLRNLP